MKHVCRYIDQLIAKNLAATFMTSLPAEAPQNVQGLTNVVEAYDICLQLQSFLQQALNIGKNIGNDMIYTRILGYLIHYPATDEQLGMVVRQIISANDHLSLLQIGQSYFSHYIRACASGSHTPLYSLTVT